MRFGILIFISLFGLGAFGTEYSKSQIDCERRLSPHWSLLSNSARRTIIRQAQRFHFAYSGKWGEGIELSRGVMVRGTLHVVVRFQQQPTPLEIVAVYDYGTKKVTSFIAPDPAGKGVQAYELE